MDLLIDSHIEVEYDDPSHRYFLRGRTYQSATQLLGKFIPEFDTDERSEYMAYRYGNTPEYWREKWKTHNRKSLDRGNLIHNQREDFLHGRGYDSIHGRHFRVYNLNTPILQALWKQPGGYRHLEDGIYPEMKLWRHDWGIAGRVDKPIIETVNGVRFFHVDDYKTNAAVDRHSFQGRDGVYKMMLEPVSHLMDCEFYHYSLQLSLYQYMAEYFGYKAGLRRIIHYPHEIPGLGTPDPVIMDDVPYLRDEVISMLNYAKQKQWLN